MKVSKFIRVTHIDDGLERVVYLNTDNITCIEEVFERDVNAVITVHAYSICQCLGVKETTKEILEAIHQC